LKERTLRIALLYPAISTFAVQICYTNCIIFNMMMEAIIWQKQRNRKCCQGCLLRGPRYILVPVSYLSAPSNNNQIEFTIKTIYSCHCLDYRDTILALKASGVSNSTMYGASRFQSRTVLGKNDIFLESKFNLVIIT
jgi:hypothetical protein